MGRLLLLLLLRLGDGEVEEEDHSNDEEDEDSSSEQSEGAATTSSLSGSDDCVEAKVDSTTNGGSSSGGGGGSGGSTKKAKKAKKAGLRKGKWTVRFVYYSLILVVSVLSFCFAPLCLAQATPVFKNSPHPSLCPQTYYVHVIATHTQQPEEEAYSTAVIRHFRAGLLRLPDGLTLRGYLAEKLNCDPMRITKKYAGAACLGKRTFSFQDR